jgi:hypothetical protein
MKSLSGSVTWNIFLECCLQSFLLSFEFHKLQVMSQISVNAHIFFSDVICLNIDCANTALCHLI